MIPFDFIYYQPDSLQEAVNAYTQLQTDNKNPVYYAGGSEIITMCRAGSIQPGAVIDIKNIAECMNLSVDNHALHIGSVCTLNEIKESKLFPLLELSCGRIADHTNQCRITLGGNLCGTIIYRETSLPLMLSDAKITLYGPQGERTVPFNSIFDGRINLMEGELIVQVHIPNWALTAQHYHVKKTTNEKIDYPLVSLAALLNDDYLRVAVSGLFSRPFRNKQIESIINTRSMPYTERVEKAIKLLTETPYSDVEGSGEYRLFIFKNVLTNLLEAWENDKI